MKLVGIELWRVDLALSNPVATSQGSHGPRPVLYVRVVTDEAEGWGECGALPGAPPSIPPSTTWMWPWRSGRCHGCSRQARHAAGSSWGRRRWLACSARGRSSASWPPPSRWRSSTLSSARVLPRWPSASAQCARSSSPAGWSGSRPGATPARCRCGRSAAGWGGTPRALQDRAGMGHRPRSGAAHRLPLGRAAGRRQWCLPARRHR